MIKYKKNGCKFIVLSLLFAVVLVMTGCASETQKDVKRAEKNIKGLTARLTSETGISIKTDVKSVDSKETRSDVNAASPYTTNEQSGESVHILGKYVGKIDCNSIEVIVDGNPLAFRLTDMTKMQIFALTEGESIEFAYKRNDEGQ